MVTKFLRLKLQLLGNSFRRKPSHIVGVVLALLYGIVLTCVAVAALVALRDLYQDFAKDIVVVFGSLVVLGYVVLPLAFGIDDSLDPRRFSLFGIPNRKLSLGLIAAAMVSLPSIIAVAIGVAQVATWSRGLTPTAFAVACVPLIIGTCVLSARVSATTASLLLGSRRARDFAGLVVVAAFVLAAPLVTFLAGADWDRIAPVVVARIANVLSWTPLGAVWSVPGDAAEGSMVAAWSKLAIAAAFVAALWFGWRLLIARMLVTRQRDAQARVYEGLGWFTRVLGSPTGAIAARSITYWGRDARYRTSLVIIPLIPVAPLAALAIAGVDPGVLALLPLPAMVLFLAWATLHNDLALDSTALWLHLASNTRGWQDRLGRAVPVLLVGVPLVAIGSILTTMLWGDWSWWPTILGFSACILFAGIGLSSLVSARFPYPVVKPGDSPYAQPQAVGSGAPVIQAMSFLGTLALASPVAYCAYLAVTDDPSWHYTALIVGLVFGLGVMFGGLAWGGRIFDRRAPELLEFTLQN